MSIDESVTKELLETLEDGRRGFAEASERLAESDTPELAVDFRQFSEQRAQFFDELRAIAAGYGDEINESGSATAALHRGWIKVKDALSGSDPKGILAAAETGEDHAVKEYEKALQSDMSPKLRTIVERQGIEVKAAHEKVRSLRDAHQ